MKWTKTAELRALEASMNVDDIDQTCQMKIVQALIQLLFALEQNW